MADNSNLNIFEGAAGRFQEALPLFSGIQSMALPVRAESDGTTGFFTLAETNSDGRPALAAFTSEALLHPPFIRQDSSETALLFFHAPHHDLFIFNPDHPQVRSGRLSPLSCSRKEISLLAGFIRSSAAAAGDPAGSGDAEFSAGNLHSAHYLYAASLQRNPVSRSKYRLCATLVELGLLQEAYDLLSGDADPEARLWLAVVYRRTGDTAQARALLSDPAISTNFAERLQIETAWLDIEEGREENARKTFARLSSSAFDKAEPLSGLAAATAKAAFKTKDRGLLSFAVSTLKSALVSPSHASARIFSQLGALYFRTGDIPQAENSYRRAAALAPSIESLANLAMTLVKAGKFAEAAAVTSRVALTDTATARRLAAGFPKEKGEELFKLQQAQAPAQQQAAPTPEPAPSAPTAPTKPQAATTPGEQNIPPAFRKPAQASATAADQNVPPAFRKPAQASSGAPEQNVPPAFRRDQQVPPGIAAAAESFQSTKKSGETDDQASLAPAQPRDASVSGRSKQTPPSTTPPSQAPAPAPARKEPPGIKIETFRDVMAGNAVMTEAESRQDEFISRAFRLASDLEDELGRKVYFNLDGLTEVERRLRLQFLKGKADPQRNIETVKDCAAFLCYFLQERHKGRLLKLTDFDPWGWPMIFELPSRKFTTYPIQRTWRLLWEETVPEPGWVPKYASWVADKIKETTTPASGAAAARAKVMSNPERLADTQAEHRRMLILASSLGEASGIEISRSGIRKLEAAIKTNFKPNVPPTSDGWKLLRCYGHILAAILIKEFKAHWYNTDGEDGGWSIRLPWNTCVFPLGKVYKTASLRDDLTVFLETLEAEKLRMHGPTPQ
ncbi:MAG: hypothetical protein M0011_15820 [Elusimicrobia bacterium]|nr:hypothetical protein [Elusimicrobiota bacterium]